jgi:hypothetical protein
MRRVALVLAVLGAASGACGGHGLSATCRAGSGRTAVPVAPGLVPTSVVGGALTVSEDPGARKSLDKAGHDGLLADGRLYTIRKGTTLVAALQVSTVKPKIDLSCQGNRRSIVTSVLPVGRQTVDIEHTRVITARISEKTVFVWFTRDFFEILQVKGAAVRPDDIAHELIQRQRVSPAWHPLPENADLV